MVVVKDKATFNLSLQSAEEIIEKNSGDDGLRYDLIYIDPPFGLWLRVYLVFFSGDFVGDKYFYFLAASIPFMYYGPFIGLFDIMEE